MRRNDAVVLRTMRRLAYTAVLVLASYVALHAPGLAAGYRPLCHGNATAKSSKKAHFTFDCPGWPIGTYYVKANRPLAHVRHASGYTCSRTGPKTFRCDETSSGHQHISGVLKLQQGPLCPPHNKLKVHIHAYFSGGPSPGGSESDKLQGPC